MSATTVSSHLRDLEDEGIIEGYTPCADYGAPGYDVVAVMHLKVGGSALTEATEPLTGEPQMVSAYEAIGNYNMLAVGRFKSTDDMNRQIRALLGEAPIRESSMSIVLNAVSGNEQFDLGDDGA